MKEEKLSVDPVKTDDMDKFIEPKLSEEKFEEEEIKHPDDNSFSTDNINNEEDAESVVMQGYLSDENNTNVKNVRRNTYERGFRVA